MVELGRITLVAAGRIVEEILEACPYLARDDVLQPLTYGGDL